MSDAAWSSDCRVLVDELERSHPAPWHATRREDFLRVLATPLPPGLSDPQRAEARAVVLQRALALLAEGHTHVEAGVFARSLPLLVRHLSDGYWVRAVAADGTVDPAIVAGRITRLGNVSVDEAVERLRPYVPAETPPFVAEGIAFAMQSVALLVAAGMADPGSRTLSIEIEQGGQRLQRTVPFSEAPPSGPMTGVLDRGGISPAETLVRGRESYWYRYLRDEGVIVFQYNRCAEDEDRPFAPFVEDLFAAVEREHPRRLIIDLRNNTGGNSSLFTNEVMPRLRRSSLAGPHAIVALIEPRVFSSGIFAVAELRRDTRAVLVGEATGEGPDHYGYPRTFTLPSTKLTLRYSRSFFRLVDGAHTGPIEPDFPVATTGAVHFAGKDPVLAAAIALPDGP
jgi:hypothetical protein